MARLIRGPAGWMTVGDGYGRHRRHSYEREWPSEQRGQEGPRCRTSYAGLLRNNRVPWEGRAEDKLDASVWAVTCFATRMGFRKRGVSRALARAAVSFARERGARAVEGYPMTTKWSAGRPCDVS